MKKIIFFFAATAALTSCTITKRHYSPGYHVEWKNAKATDGQSMPICNHDFDAQDFSKIKSSASKESSVLQELSPSQNVYCEWTSIKSTSSQKSRSIIAIIVQKDLLMKINMFLKFRELFEI